jgi:hypothetical protein
MRFMMLVKASDDSEAGRMPSEALLTAMGAFNEEMVNAGVMLAGEGLHPTANAVRVAFADGRPTVTDGPFTESKELIAGFWVIQAKSLDEAIEWAKRCPSLPDSPSEIEIRQVYEPEDFGVEFTPELREAAQHMRRQSATNATS